MGKLGAHELNLSSDIDLIFGYPEGGETEGAKRALDNQEFFIRLGQKLIKALDAITVDGFAFRVDMRLRPYGSSGALVLSFNALEQYYQDQGRDWERYAMIKARVVGGDQQAGAQLLKMLRPFVYRRYLDFSAIEALRSMKQLIQQEVRRKGMTENVKLGSGGIREVEFIAQAFQLIHGGRDLSLQQRRCSRCWRRSKGRATCRRRWWPSYATAMPSCATPSTPCRPSPTGRRRCSRTTTWTAPASPSSWASATGRPSMSG